jgi:hypothetical protein
VDFSKANLSPHLQREEVLGAKGGNPELTDQLLEDAQQWTALRKVLAQHIKRAGEFTSRYHRLYQEENAYEDCRIFLLKFQSDVEQRLDSLDTTSQNLIGIVRMTRYVSHDQHDSIEKQEFNLVTIQEARKSVTMAASLKRLSWITVIPHTLLTI